MNNGKDIKVYFEKEKFHADRWSLGINVNGIQTSYTQGLSIEQLSKLANSITDFLKTIK